MDLTSFNQNLPIKVKDIIQLISKNNFLVGIIGGVPRDYIINNEIGNDFDCEIRPLSGDITEWDVLKNKLNSSYQLEELNYNIVRINIGEYNLEITLPRIENFNGKKGHSNFDAEYIADLDYSQGFLRRDFTINAIMFEYDGQKWDLKDPLGGVEDLKKKQLKICSSSFYLDPVRFLRAFRFKTSLYFEISDSLMEQLEKINLSGLTSYYIKTELSKSSRPLVMLKRIMDSRADLIEDLTMHGDIKTFIQYDKFYTGDLEAHIGQAVVLPTRSRTIILEKLGFSSKNILPNVTFDESWKSLVKENFSSEKFKQFYGTLVKLENLDIRPEKLNYLLDFFSFDMNAQTLEAFKDQKYELTQKDKLEDKEFYKYIKFYNRVKELSDKF